MNYHSKDTALNSDIFWRNIVSAEFRANSAEIARFQEISSLEN